VRVLLDLVEPAQELLQQQDRLTPFGEDFCRVCLPLAP
jgi:hypothetical protein